MSRAAKLTLAGTSFMAASTVVFVHYSQQSEKTVSPPFPYTVSPTPSQESTENILLFTTHYHGKKLILFDYLKAMHAGVIRDIEQQRVKKERQADFEMQRVLEEEYRKVQTVHDGAGGGGGGSG